MVFRVGFWFGLLASVWFSFRLGHLAQKLASKTREAFHVPSLAFGKHGIEGKRTFSAPADTRQTDQLIARKGYVNRAKVVFASTFNLKI